MISPGLFVVLALAALAASAALLSARLELFVVADVFAVSAAVLGLAAFLSAAWSTVRHARRLPPRASRR